MHFDLSTFYLLIVGTLLAGAGMMFWERGLAAHRSKTLRILGAGLVVLAAGCAVALFRRFFPSAIGSAGSNLIILSGYLIVLHGVASFNGRRHLVASLCMLVGMALVWAIWGSRWQLIVWAYVSALPIALASGMTAWEMWRCTAVAPLSARRVVIAAESIHALFYAVRAFFLPSLVAAYGQDLLPISSKITMYEGVLFSVVMPMALLKLVRDEAHGRLLREARTDYLTRMGNRRWFFEEGSRVIGSGAGQKALSILAFDLDRFKIINDRHGHETGDRVLALFAEIVRGVLPSSTILARMGGEEFAALLAGDDARRARLLGETVARQFAETVLDQIDGIGIQATVSIGLAHFESGMSSLAKGLAAADQALYQAKSLGGNRLELA
jgi:diguanylate cyclase (GGDEF)-like protein